MSACVCVWHIWHNRKNADQKNEMKETKSSSLLSSGVATRCRHRLFDSIHCCCCCRKWISSVLILNVYHSKRIIGFMYWRAPFTQWHFWREQVIVALINGLIKSRPDEWEEPKKHHPRRRYYTLSVRRVRNDATRINVQTYGWVRCGQMEELIGARTNNYCCSFTNLYIAIGMCLCAMKIEKKKKSIREPGLKMSLCEVSMWIVHRIYNTYFVYADCANSYLHISKRCGEFIMSNTRI